MNLELSQGSYSFKIVVMTTTTKPEPFSVSDLMSDVVLLVEGRQLHVNKTVLALCSPVFQKMFFGEFKEKELSEIPLPGKKYSEMLEFLLCIYPSTSNDIEEENVDSLLALSEEYSVNALKAKCRSFLLNKLKICGETLSKITLVHFLALADKYGFDDVIEECLSKLVNHEYGDIYGLQAIEEFEQVDSKTQVQFFKKRLLLVESLVRSVLVNSFSSSGKIIDDFEIILTNQCSEFTHRHSRHECRECKVVCCARCRKLATSAMEDLAHAIKNLLPAFKESE